MAIGNQSRYKQGTLLRLPDSSGNYNLSVIRPINYTKSNYVLYVWQNTDRPDLVAEALLGSPSLWWSIFDINPELIYPLNIPPGTVVRIPTQPIMGQGTILQ